MKTTELDLNISSVTAAKAHDCDYCGDKIPKGSRYTKIVSRICKKERFGVTLKACSKHQPGLLPLSFVWTRK